MDRMEERLDALLARYDEYFEKMMQGFKCIQKAFALNSSKGVDLPHTTSM